MSASRAIDVPRALPAEVDVIVVGSGAAALTGAFAAANSGLCVLVLEKSSYLGGTCAYSGGAMWLPGNHILERDGVEDDVETGLTYFRATVGDRTPRDLQEAYVRTGPEMVAFLADEAGFLADKMSFPDYFEAPGRAKPTGRAIGPTPIPSARLGAALDVLRPTAAADKFGRDVARAELHGGQSLIAQLLLALDGCADVDIRIECPMDSLVYENGRVCGVRAGRAEIVARLGVIVAAGGYDADDARRRSLQGIAGGGAASTPVGINTGDALDAFMAVGADIDLLEEAWWAPGIVMPTGRATFLPIVQGGIFVGTDGRRFADESLPYDRLGHELLEQVHRLGADATFWWVFDSRDAGAPGICEPPLVLEEFTADSEWFHTAETVKELAGKLGIDADTLAATVERFNKGAADGRDDDFGRGIDDFGRFFGTGNGSNPALIPLEIGPFRAMRLVLSDLGTKGGARIGTDGEVLRPDGQPIPGLYAAGGSAASVAGHVYPGPGTPLGSGMVFAYRAAKAMARARGGARTPEVATR